VPSDARFCGNGRPMYCERSACRGGSLGALAGQGGGKTGGMNQGNGLVGGFAGSAPGTPLAVCSKRACRDNSFTPVNRIEGHAYFFSFSIASDFTVDKAYLCDVFSLENSFLLQTV